MAGEVAFIEIGVDDVGRGRRFYEGLFGQWRFRPGSSEQGVQVDTPNMRAGMHGGDPGASLYVFFLVDDIDAALDRVRELGGAVEDMEVEGDAESVARFGRFRLCRDDQGSAFGLHERPRG